MEITEEEIENRLLEISDSKNYSGWFLVIVSTIGMAFSALAAFLYGLLLCLLLLAAGFVLVHSAMHDRKIVIERYLAKEKKEEMPSERVFMPAEEKTPSSEKTSPNTSSFLSPVKPEIEDSFFEKKESGTINKEEENKEKEDQFVEGLLKKLLDEEKGVEKTAEREVKLNDDI